MDADNGVVQATVVPQVEHRACPLGELEHLIHEHYRALVKIPMYARATKEEAKAAVAEAIQDLLRTGVYVADPLAWLRKAVLSNFLKAKARDLERVRARLVERGAGAAEGCEDPRLTFWEDRQWVMQMITMLPPKQAEVMALIVDGLTPTQIAGLLGRSPEAVRQSLLEARRRLLQAIQQERADEQQSGRTARSSKGEAR